jgi:hypothetical protein
MTAVPSVSSRPRKRAGSRFIGDISGSFVFVGRGLEDERLRVHPCRARSVSTSLAVVTSDASAEVGEPVVLRLENIGIRRGVIERCLHGGFIIKIEPDAEGTAVLERRIDWLRQKSQGRAENKRIFKRVLPRDPNVRIVLGTGEQLPCRIRDMSASGVAVMCDTRPALGHLVAIGSVPGTIVRHFKDGFAVRFTALQDLTELEGLMTLKTPQEKAMAAERLGLDG